MNIDDYIQSLKTFNNANWLAVRVDLLNAMAWETAIVLSAIINRVAWKLERGKTWDTTPDGWVMLTNKELKKRLASITDYRAAKAIKDLTKMGVMHHKKRGVPGKRWVVLEMACVEELVLSKTAELVLSKTTPVYSKSTLLLRSKVQDKQQLRPSGSRQIVSITKDPHLTMAEKLHATLAKSRKVQATSTPKKWAEPLRKLEKLDKIPLQDIQDLMTWYCNKVEKEGDLIRSNGSFLPVVYGGDTFRKKWQMLQEARKRHIGPEDRKKLKVSATWSDGSPIDPDEEADLKEDV